SRPLMPIIDIHTHCAPPLPPDDPFGVAEAMRGIPSGRNIATNYRGLPAVSYREMHDFALQQELSVKAGVSGRIMSTPFTAEAMAAVSKSPALDICKAVNDGIAGIVERARGNWGLGTLNPLDKSHIAEGERCLSSLKFKGLLITTSWHGRF